MQVDLNTQEAAPYSFDHLVSEFKMLLNFLPDTRRQNKSYQISDAALAAFSVFFMQSPSFLAHQARMEKERGQNNARSLFQVENIPSDNQVRNLLDRVDPALVNPMFDHVFNGLNSVGYFEHYRSINKTILIALDGVNYFSSKKIHCEKCNSRKHDNGEISYFHHAVTPVIVAPENPRVISLTPEFVTQQDGHDKQDGEHAAVKRWLKQHGRKYRGLGITILGDDLYSHQPICEAIKQEGFHFILTCKPKSHKSIYENVEGLEKIGKIKTIIIKREEGEKTVRQYVDTYRFINNIPIRDTEDALCINWCELKTIDSSGKMQHIKSYITDHEITESNVVDIVRAGRTRWKIENENNNTLKNHGYHLEHNFGHGIQYLSQLLITLNLLAFLFHTVLDIMDQKYQMLREKLPTRKIFFEHIRALTTYMFFTNWDALLQFMLDGLNKRFHVKLITVPE
jgi:hypothetical protein